MAAHAVETKRPQPLMTRASVIAAISGLITALMMFGILPATLGDQLKSDVEAVVGPIATLVSIVPPIVHALISRNHVTPTSSPRDNAGNELVPAGSTADTDAAAAAALATAEATYPSTPADEPVTT